MKMTYKYFAGAYSDNDICLEKLFQLHYGQFTVCPYCNLETTFHKLKRRRCYECKQCGHQIYPTAGTVFEKTRTLSRWFLAIFLIAAEGRLLSAGELYKQLNISYQTALRLERKIRRLIEQAEGQPSCLMKIDSSYLKNRGKRPESGEKARTLVSISDPVKFCEILYRFRNDPPPRR
jgi:transposase-like protein